MDSKALAMKNAGGIVKITSWLPLRKDFEDIADKSQNHKTVYVPFLRSNKHSLLAFLSSMKGAPTP